MMGARSRFTRAGIWVLLVLAALNGLFLYFVPAQAETHYAWSIKPSVNAAFIGAEGIPCVLFGPAGEGAHATEEWVSLSSCEAVRATLVDVARHVCR